MSDPDPGDAAGADGLRRQLGLLDATTINIGTMLGTAILLVPGQVAAACATPWQALGLWLAGGLLSMLGALAMAELAAMMPEAGGQYAYLRRAFTPFTGWLYAWTTSVVINPASIAAIGIGFATYAAPALGLGPMAVLPLAVASIVALTLLNCLGLREGARVQTVLTVLKMLGLAAFGVAGLAAGGADAAAGAAAAPRASPVLALIAVLWAYDGWMEVTLVGSEVRDPARVLPRSIVLGMGAVVALYVLANAGMLAVLPIGALAESDRPAAAVAEALGGAAGVGLVTLLMTLSSLGSNNGIILSAARVPYAMARQGEFFAWAGVAHPTRHVPVNVLLVQGAWSIVLAMTGTYDQLITSVVAASWVFYGLSAVAVLRLRRTEPDAERPYRAWGYPWGPVLFAGASVAVVVASAIDAPVATAGGIGLLALGWPALLALRASGGRVGGQGGQRA
ncbi:MAG: amino acid permease [Gemmatimonadales bacterium]|nr:amino acid permease [Gemmatimonadales bacterium]